VALPPSGRYDERKKVGIWTGPARGIEVEKYQYLADKPYVINCEGDTEVNLGVPEENWSVGPDSGYIDNGTYYRYFLGDKETVINYYKNNDPSTGITFAEREKLSPEQQGLYCQTPSEDGIYYRLETTEHPREVSIDIYADIWYPETSEDLRDESPCPPEGKLLRRLTVTGNDYGTVYGRGPYADISDMNAAAVHAGLIQKGEDAVIDVKSASPDLMSDFQGSTFNGITSLPLSTNVSGVILEVGIDQDGQLGEGEIIIDPMNVGGDGAAFEVTLDGQGQLSDVTIIAGGSNYNIGDKFRVTTFDMAVQAEFVVTRVTQAVTGGVCGVNIDLNTELTNVNIPYCEPEVVTKKLTVDGETANIRGPINGVKVLNPFANPKNVFSSLSTTDFDWNWYYSCPPSDVDTGPLESNNIYHFKQISGSSLEQDHNQAVFDYEWSFYQGQLTGCCPGSGCGTANRINWKVNKVSTAHGGDGYAVGDRFVLTQRSTSPGIEDGYENTEVIIEVTNVIGDIDSPGTITYYVEKDVELIYDKPELDTILDLVTNVTVESTTDIVLAESTNQTMSLFLGTLGRFPSDMDFQVYTRMFYDSGATITDEIQQKFDSQFKQELNADIIKVLSTCDRQLPDDIIDELPSGTITNRAFTLQEVNALNDLRRLDTPTTASTAAPSTRAAAPGVADPGSGTCLYRRNSFWQGDSLNNLWKFLGKPKGPSGAGGASAGEIVCPKPAGVQDNEPDFSDFAGMTLWRWKDCGLGTSLSSIGSYEEVIVPCPGYTGDGNAQRDDGPPPEPRIKTKEDAYAVYNEGATITYNDGSVRNTDGNGNSLDLVSETKDSTATAINNQYLTTLQRPAEQEGMKYWYAEANRLVDDDIATYYPGARMKFADGFETTGNFVQSTKNTTAAAINAKYEQLFGRPAEQAGLRYWYDEALRTSLEQTLSNIEVAGQPEIDRGGMTEFCYGLCRTLEWIVIAAEPELARGYPESIEYSYDSGEVDSSDPARLTGGDIDLSWFRDTALPNPDPVILLDGDPGIYIGRPGDLYLAPYPNTQTNNYTGYTDDSFTTMSETMTAEIEMDWPTIPGGPDALKTFGLAQINWIEVHTLCNTTKGEFGTFKAARAVHLQGVAKEGNLLSTDDYSVLTEQSPEFGRLSLYQGWFSNWPEEWEYLELYLDWTTGVFDGSSQGFFTGPTVSNHIFKFTLDNIVDLTNTIPQNTAKFLSYGQDPSNTTEFTIYVKAYSQLVEHDGTYDEPGKVTRVLDEKVSIIRPDYGPNEFRYFFGAGCPTKTCQDGSVICQTETCNDGPCPEGYKTCPDGTRRCITEDCPPTQPCQPRVTCGQSTYSKEVETGEYLDLTFSFTTGISSCQEQGYAKVSIHRYWPCPTFSPTPPTANQWLVQKQVVQVVNGKAEYVLKNVNTTKSDYLAGDSKYGDPGNCHWVYVAYWEFYHTNYNCQWGKWTNPGCNLGGGHNQLDEILCIQKQNCNTDDYENGAGSAQQCIDTKNYLSAEEWPNPDEQIDPFTCLPYCDTVGLSNFYWIGEGQVPQPGVNCTNRDNVPGSTDPEECTEDCPVCEQIIKVVIADATVCGPRSAPKMVEGTSPSINNGRFRFIDGTIVQEPNFQATVIEEGLSGLVQVCNASDSPYLSPKDYAGPCVNINLDCWVSLPSVRFDTEVTLGVDNAVDFTVGSGTDYAQIYQDCCVAYAPTYTCINFVQESGCLKYEEGFYDDNTQPEADCDAKVIVVGHWFYKINYKNGTSSDLIPLDSIAGANAQNPGEPYYKVPTDVYPISAGNDTNATLLTYQSEVGGYSYFRNIAGGENRVVPYSDATNNIEIHLQIKASNDHFGNVIYDNPPLGFNSRDFGTDITIESPRFPWNYGTQGPGPKDTIFYVGKFKISETQDLPKLDGWDAVILGCEDAQVYEPYNYRANGYFCGVQGAPNYYECFLDYDEDKYFQENWQDPVTKERKSDSFARTCNPDRMPPGCAPPESDVVLSVGAEPSNIGFPVDWGSKTPLKCTGGLKIMWYVDGVVRSRGYIDPNKTGTGDGGYYISFDYFNCNNDPKYGPDYFSVKNQKTRDLSQFFTDPNKQYKVEMYLIANGDYNFVAHQEPNLNQAITDYAIHRGDTRRPINIIDDIQEGEFYQVIVGYDTCTIQGNNNETPGGGVITDFDDPSFTITSNVFTTLFQEYARGTLTAVIQNLPDAWPTNPNTGQDIIGTVTYKWERRLYYDENQWEPVEGGTGESIEVRLDGNIYRCTVTFDMTEASIPEGYVVTPQTRSSTKEFTVLNNPTVICPDGQTVVLLGNEDQCPAGPCGQPVFVGSQILYAKEGEAKVEKIAVGKGETVRVYVEATYSGFSNPKLKWNGLTADVYDGGTIYPGDAFGTRSFDVTVNLNATHNGQPIDPNLHEQDQITFTNYIDFKADKDMSSYFHCRLTMNFDCLETNYTPGPNDPVPPGTPNDPVPPPSDGPGPIIPTTQKVV